MTGFTSQQLLASLNQSPSPERYLVGFSGGRDSHVLVHALATIAAQLPAAITVVHIHHGLQTDAEHWVSHCQAVCDGLGLPLQVIRVNARADTGESPEAAARQARYDAFATLMTASDCLLTAHHQDDQAETLLLQLLRGAGPHGLAAMPGQKAFAHGSHRRPLLAYSRAELNDYAQQLGLDWIHDASNDDCSFRRNYLRHQVIPNLQAQWPAWGRTLSRSAVLNADAAELLDEMAAADLAAILSEGAISVTHLLCLSANRQRNVMRYWCSQRQLPLPSQAHLLEIQRQIASGGDQMPMIGWKGTEMRRYRDGLYLMSALILVDARHVTDWDLQAPLAFNHGRLTASRGDQPGLAASRLSDRVTIRFRQGGEQIQLASGQHHPLKKLLQEYQVPPWMRNRVPLIYSGDELVAVAGIVIAQPYRSRAGETAISIDWESF